MKERSEETSLAFHFNTLHSEMTVEWTKQSYLAIYIYWDFDLTEGNHGMHWDVSCWYSRYLGYFSMVIDSPKFILPWNRRMSCMQPTKIHDLSDNIRQIYLYLRSSNWTESLVRHKKRDKRSPTYSDIFGVKWFDVKSPESLTCSPK